MRVFVGRAPGLFSAIEDDPAWCGGEKILHTGKRETMLVDQLFHAFDFINVAININSVIGARFPKGFDKTLLFILPDPFLRQANPPGDVID